MRKVLARAAVFLGMAGAIVQGQPLADQVNFKTGQLGGIRIYGVSVFSGYSTTVYPVGLGPVLNPGVRDLGGSATYGATVSLGWQRHRESSNVSILYSGSYNGLTRYSDLNAFGHTVSAGVSRTFGQKWVFGASGSIQDATMMQYLYQPTSLSVLSQMPTSFDDLAAAFAAGRFTNSQAAALLTGAPLLSPTARSLLLGNRTLSYGVQAGLSYAHSSRLRFRFSSFSAGGQTHRGKTETIPEQRYGLPRSGGLSGGVSMDYSLSPRTQIGLGVENSYLINRFQRGSVTSATGNFGRKMGMRWFLSLNGGMAHTHITSDLYQTPPSRQFIGGGSIGFRTFQHTLVGTYSRSASDTYGFAIGTSTATAGSWGWRRPGSRWSVTLSGEQQQIRRAGFASLSGWTASATVSQRLGGGMSLNTQYVMFRSLGSYLDVSNSWDAHSIRVSFSWAPQYGVR